MPPTRTLPNLENCSRDELELALRCSPHRRAVRRLMAILELSHGVPFETVARIQSTSERSLQRWVADFNAYGIDGLLDAQRSGRPRALPPQEPRTAQVLELVEKPELAGHAHWTGRKFHGHLTKELGVEIGYSTTIRFLHENNFRLKVPQPWPDRQDEALRALFCEQLKALEADQGVELWFGDESGVEGDPRPRRRWAKKGEKARVTKNGDHVRMNVCGIVAPRTGEAYLLEFTHSDTDTFQVFLDEANKDIGFPRKRNVLVLDNASWHKGKGLRWGAFEPLFLPPYSPDLNPIERLWLVMKAYWFTDFVAKTHEALEERLDEALRWLVGRAGENRRTCSIKTEL